MIVTLTPNPSIDRTVAVERLRRGEVHRGTSSRIDPGGKGVNVSRALAAQGAPTVAVLPVGGPEGHLMQELLDAAQVAHAAVPVAGAVRTNITVVEPDGTTTKLNEPGPRLAASEVDTLLVATLDQAAGPDWVVGCGSLPPGAPTDLYASLVSRVRGRGGRVAIDSSGVPLAAAVRARPHLVKPNHDELAELVGRELATISDVEAAARGLVAGGIETVAVSLGADGALLVTATDVVHARATISSPLSTVGAGDCLLAGLLHGLSTGQSAPDALTTGVLWGAAAVTLPGSRVPSHEELRGIDVQVTTDPDLSHSLAR